MNRPILYLGDTSLSTAACYLAGCMADAGLEFDYLPSHERLTLKDLESPHSLLIISDYPAAHISPDLQEIIVQQVDAGMGLLMIGGWESFQGSDGKWAETPLARILPVTISPKDDRQNCDQPVFVRPQDSSKAASHP
ncbi:MAG: hypothetical protein KDA78_11110, partial [Planctomycetaceae bacterium]|nr:hypothetical protein [Planctomycetaceae bacterium]